MTRRVLLFPALLLVLVACGAKPVESKRYPIRGVVKALDGAARSATIQHEKIGDWMEAMTMEFPIKPPAEFYKLHIGDRIEGVVVVEDVKYYVTELKVTGKAQQ